MNLEQFLQEKNEVARRLHIEYAKASWMAATTGEIEWDQKTAEAETEYRTYFSNSDLFKQVKDFIKEEQGEHLQKRQLAYLYSGMVENQLSPDKLK